MQTFLEETIEYLLVRYSNFSDLTIVFPSKRAGGFFKNYLKNAASSSFFLPKIISIEEFIEELSSLKIANSTELVFDCFEAYCQTSQFKEKDNFETFSTWVNTVLNDFNEIDRYLVDSTKFFNYLKSIQDLQHWAVQNEQTEMVKKYLQFWEALPHLYDNLNNLLLRKEIGYQGMVYREAAASIEYYIQNNTSTHIFVGFNALNTAEQVIFKELAVNDQAEIIWDADEYLLKDRDHSASYFLRKYLKWKIYQDKPAKFVGNQFSKPKNIQIVAAQKSISQAKYLGHLLATYSKEKLEKTAIVLADENLLIPALNSLPENVDAVNVTMGAPLKSFPAAIFFQSILQLHKKAGSHYYYKDVQNILQNPFITLSKKEVTALLSFIAEKNLSWLNATQILEFSDLDNTEMLQLLFNPWNESGSTAIANCIKLLKIFNQQKDDRVNGIVLHSLMQVFKELEGLQEKFEHLTSIGAVEGIFSEIIATSSVDFKGDAYHGLQIMGVLETRCLDFENVIMLSVNEGILPAGKPTSSYITYDLKKEFGLPMFSEKDAVYTYHFYRLLHRAKDVILLYNETAEGLSAGEKSRFLLQLEMEKHPNHTLKISFISPTITSTKKELISISKNETLLDRLKEIAESGFSPSALTAYIRNPLDFYYQKILSIKEVEEVEETVAYNTLGTIVHNTLEAFYKPWQGSLLKVEALKKTLPQIEKEVTQQFNVEFGLGNYKKGKNLIIFEVAKRYVENLIKMDISEIESGNTIFLKSVEKRLRIPLNLEAFDFPIHLKGTVDRVDVYNGKLRIIDYKTGTVQQNEVEITDWENLIEDYKYSKAFQVLSYSFMMQNEIENDGVTAGIISFKNLNNGFLPFAYKESSRGPKNALIEEETLKKFKDVLEKLLTEIFDASIPITEKEIQ